MSDTSGKGPTLTPAPDRTQRVGIVDPDPRVNSWWQTSRPASLRDVDASSPTELRLERLERELGWLWRAGVAGWLLLALGLVIEVVARLAGF